MRAAKVDKSGHKCQKSANVVTRRGDPQFITARGEMVRARTSKFRYVNVAEYRRDRRHCRLLAQFPSTLCLFVGTYAQLQAA